MPIQDRPGRHPKPKVDKEYETIDTKWLRAWLYSLALPFETADVLCGLPKGTLADIVSRRGRMDADGMRSVDVWTKRKIMIGLSTVRPIFTVVQPPPIPKRRKVPSKMVGPLPGMSGRRELPNYGDNGTSSPTSDEADFKPSGPSS
jgi:hypothetical protein